MRKNNSKSLKKFISIFITNLVSVLLIGGLISNLKGFQLKDVLFVEGILVLMMGVFSSIGVNTEGLSLREFVQINPQCVTNIVLESNSLEKERVVSASNIQINMDLVSTAITLGAIVSLIISYLL